MRWQTRMQSGGSRRARTPSRASTQPNWRVPFWDSINFMSDLRIGRHTLGILIPNRTRGSLGCAANQCIEQSKLSGMELASRKCPTVLSRSHIHKAFEGSRKVTLVGKPGVRSNRCQRNIRRTKLAAGVFDAKLTNVFSDGTTTKPAEPAG